MSIREINREPDYTDIDLDFLMNKTTNDVSIKSGEAAIKRSIYNLLSTNFFERPFQSYIGSGVRALLFEPMSPFTATQLQDAIELCIANFEPRVKLTKVKISVDEDNYGFNVRLEYIILNKNLPVVTTMFLERIR